MAGLLSRPTEAGTGEWTSVLLGALAQLGEAGGHCVEPSPSQLRERAGRSEFLWDLTVSSWPRYGGTDPGFVYPTYYQNVESSELVMVAESEWGKLRGWHANGSAVLEDFSKLLAARCPLKVMIFSYHHRAEGRASYSSYSELVALMGHLIDRSQDDATYVLFGVAWDHSDPAYQHPVIRTRRAR
jgi:hypothetical protein